MKHIAIIGSSGMLGSDLVRYLGTEYQITQIDKKNYQKHIGSSFDIVINANGNSRRFWANNHPLEDFIASTESVYKSMFDFTHTVYIYISSSDVYNDHTSTRYTKEDRSIEASRLFPYGLHKYISEQIVQKYAKNYLILRSSMILGRNLKKGPVYDIMKRSSLFISSRSKLQMITTEAISQIIRVLLQRHIYNEIFNMGGNGVVSLSKVQQYVHWPVIFQNGSETQIYEMSTTKLNRLHPLKSSIMYLKEFLQIVTEAATFVPR